MPGGSLFQATWDRLVPLCGDHIMVVTGILHEAAVQSQLPGLALANILAEPSPRDSMAAIRLAAAILERRDPEALIGSFAAGHVTGEPEVFGDCVREAVAVARTGYVVTIGIEPTHPATGTGQVHVGVHLAISGAPNGHQVSSFLAKPDEMTATSPPSARCCPTPWPFLGRRFWVSSIWYGPRTRRAWSSPARAGTEQVP